jgi:hypothetical protein
MSNILTLHPSGTDGCKPDQDPWAPPGGANVKICNKSGHRQTLSEIKNGVLTKPGQGAVTSITLDPGTYWEGRAAAAGRRGTYQYNDGIRSPALDMRTGTIDPS